MLSLKFLILSHKDQENWENRSASAMTSTLVYRYRGFNCRKKQFSRSYRNNLNSAWKKINAACLPFITNVCSHPRRLSYAFAECKMRARRRNSTVLRYGSEWGRKRGGRVQSLSWLCDRFFFLSRVMLSRCVCYSTVKEYRFCTSR